ncbi:fibrous sheath-interacting protein 1 isoform X1 [Polypterus senegalus]|uniref:fibrous sheath-interacting protein 1 isoform X1 n=1 Tax=Polypterus senegalus TaxID=55291 RepID=UPI00196272E2|nr:fibrous sheath-interacting protein 1 isoform X1 [Polypterus senegalus]XP_039597945.1 fibrous sheath-interacting protein 1 isoform X1 [Polypterus senegalus]
MDICKGSLDEISRPASGSRSRTGSRISSSRQIDRQRTGSACSRSLEVLSPEKMESENGSVELEDVCTSPESSDSEKSGQTCKTGGTSTPHKHDLAQAQILQPTTADAVDAAKGNASDWTEDPELFKAIEKMKRLDKILASAVLKEKEVKQQGNELRVKLWDELQSSKSEDNPETHEESENTRKFLALTPASNFSIEDSTIVHVFETQLADEEFDQYFSKPMQQVHGDWTESIAKLEASPDTDTSDRPESRCSRVKQKKKKKRDFVKKNIELAKDAGNQVLMTDNEKKRLAELLRDIDNDRSDTLPRDEADVTLAVIEETDEFDSLKAVDARLQVLLSSEDISVVFSPGSFSGALQESKTDVKSIADINPGEKALQDVREKREQESRLREINYELEQLSNGVQKPIESASLTEEQLNELLADCIRVQSRTECSSQEMSPSFGSSTSLAQLTPQLSESVLSQLLEEAGQSGIFSIKAMKNDDEDEEDSSSGHYLSWVLANCKHAERLLMENKEAAKSKVEESTDDSCYMSRAIRTKKLNRPAFLDDPSYTSSSSVNEPLAQEHIPCIPDAKEGHSSEPKLEEIHA